MKTYMWCYICGLCEYNHVTVLSFAGIGSIVVEVSRVYDANNMLSRIDVTWNPLVSHHCSLVEMLIILS